MEQKEKKVNSRRTWKGAAAARAGPSHTAAGTPCQDRAALIQTAGGVLMAAVADGAGSSSEAEAGADTAVRAALAELERQLGETGKTENTAPGRVLEALRSAVQAAHDGVLARSQEEETPLRHYHTTLLLAVHTGETLGTAHIGDGGIVAARGEGYRLVSPPQQGEYANQTRFVTDPGPLEHVRTLVEPHPGWDRLALFSDGLQRLVLDHTGGGLPEPHAPFFDRLFAWLDRQENGGGASPALERFLASPAVSGRTRDDVSLAAASMRPEPNR